MKISKEEKDNIVRSVKKVKRGPEGWVEERSKGEDMTTFPTEDDHEDERERRTDERRKISFRDMVIGESRDIQMEEQAISSDDELSDDNVVGEEDVGPRIKRGMTKEEKKKARKPWKHSVTIKLVGRHIGFHILH